MGEGIFFSMVSRRCLLDDLGTAAPSRTELHQSCTEWHVQSMELMIGCPQPPAGERSTELWQWPAIAAMTPASDHRRNVGVLNPISTHVSQGVATLIQYYLRTPYHRRCTLSARQHRPQRVAGNAAFDAHREVSRKVLHRAAPNCTWIAHSSSPRSEPFPNVSSYSAIHKPDLFLTYR